MPPAFGRLGARLEDTGPCTTAVHLPLTPELLLPDGRSSGAVTSLLADFALTTSVIASLPDLRGVTTVALTVEHLGLPPTSGSLMSRCTATAYADGRPQHAAGALHDDTGRQVAAVSCWFLAAPAEEALARRGFVLYRDALRTCRDDLGMRLLQPGRALNPGPRGEAPILWFFPLPHPEGGGLSDLLRQRFDAYLADQRESFFEPYFRRFRRQAVLVDVLGALHAGQAAFEDTADALAAIAAALRAEESWLDRFIGVGPERVAFAATKADHVPSRQRDALAALLGSLVGAEPGAPSSVHVLASVRCTEDDVATLDGRPVAAVRGVLLENGRSAHVYPGEVPLRPPEPGYWQHGFFRMPEFQPPRLDPGGATGVPHLGLDTLLARLIGDLL